MEFHGAREAPDELCARVLELRRALLHQALEFGLAVGEREVRAHPRQQQLPVDRLGEVVHRADVEPLDLLGGLGLAGEEDDRDVRGGGVFLEQLADLEAGGARHVDVQQDQVRLGRLRRERQGVAAVGGELHFVLGAEHHADQVEQVLRVVHREDHRPGAVLGHAAESTVRCDRRDVADLTGAAFVYNRPRWFPQAVPLVLVRSCAFYLVFRQWAKARYFINFI